MALERRNILLLGVGLAAASVTSAFAGVTASHRNNLFGIRSLGNPKAGKKIIEYFSLGCPHCAEFATHTLKPKIVPSLIDTGKLYYVFRDFPLDGVSLMAAQVARALPAHDYFPFIEILFSHQLEWAYAPKLKTKRDYESALFKYAALAGMSRNRFDAAIADKKLSNFILAERRKAEQKYHVDATPTFIFDDKKYPGAMDFKQFSAMIGEG